MDLRGLALFLFFPAGSASRAIRNNHIDGSEYDVQQQSGSLANGLQISAEARQVFLPGGLGARIFRRHAGALRKDGRRAAHLEPPRATLGLRFGPRRAEVALKAVSGPEGEAREEQSEEAAEVAKEDFPGDDYEDCREKVFAALEKGALAKDRGAELLRSLDALACFSPEERLVIYKDLLSLARRDDGSTVPLILSHLLQQRDLRLDAAVAHLAVAEAVYRGQLKVALARLETLRAAGAPLDSGTFDLVIQRASKQRDRRVAYEAYRTLRRARLTPTAFTLNALLNVEIRTGHPEKALELLVRAKRGKPRWPGEAPDHYSYTTAMAAAIKAKRYTAVNPLFIRMTNDPQMRNRLTTVPYNLAIEARLRARDKDGAKEIFRRMVTGAGGAPSPGTDTFNSMLNTRALSSQWILEKMRLCQVEPDHITLALLVRNARTLSEAERFWRWGEQQGIHRTEKTWHNYIEAHVRHGQPGQAAVLFQLMESGDGISAAGIRSHNLYLRALVAAGQPADALAHLERMCECSDAPPRLEPLKSESWLSRDPPPPDGYSYSIALTAMRSTGGDASLMRTEEASRGAARRATQLVDQAIARGTWSDRDVPPPAVLHALITACGTDVSAASAIYRDYVRPRLLPGRALEVFAQVPSAPGEQPTAEQAAVHALFRVCGAAGRPDQALSISFALRRDGAPLDGSCMAAYLRGKEAAGPSTGFFRGAYERLLELELDPERATSNISLPRIRIQFSPPEDSA